MAANSNTTLKIASFGKRFVTHHIPSAPSLSSLISRRSLHASVYDKNIEDHVRPAVVPDDIIQLKSEKYWAPNPNTGIFGPAAEQGSGGERGFHTTSANGGSESVLEQKAFFRPLEDLEKPQQA